MSAYVLVCVCVCGHAREKGGGRGTDTGRARRGRGACPPAPCPWVLSCNLPLARPMLGPCTAVLQAGRTFTEGASQQEWSRWATQPPQPDKDKQHDKGREGFS